MTDGNVVLENIKCDKCGKIVEFALSVPVGTLLTIICDECEKNRLKVFTCHQCKEEKDMEYMAHWICEGNIMFCLSCTAMGSRNGRKP